MNTGKKSKKPLVVLLLGLVLLILGAVGLYFLSPLSLPGSLGIIGGADGPTAIFVTGPGAEFLSEDLVLGVLTWGPVVLLGIGAVLCLAGGVLLARGRKK